MSLDGKETDDDALAFEEDRPNEPDVNTIHPAPVAVALAEFEQALLAL